MSVSDFIQFVIAACTAAAAVAAWRSAKASRQSVTEQKQANDQAAKNTERQIRTVSEQIEVLSEQAKAADAHAKTVREQAQAEAIRWSTQAHLDLETKARDGGYAIAQRMRGSVAAAEFSLFRAGLLPLDFFAYAVVLHLDNTIFQESWRTAQRTAGPPAEIISCGRRAAAGLTTDGDMLKCVQLWEAVNSAINKTNPEKGSNGSLSEKGKAALIQAVIDAMRTQLPEQGP